MVRRNIPKRNGLWRLSKQLNLTNARVGSLSSAADAKPYVINKLKEQIAALENCVDLNDSKVDNQLLILLRDTLYKALYVEGRADVLIVGMRLNNRPEIERVDLVDLVYSTKLNDPQTVSMNCWKSAAVFEATRPSPAYLPAYSRRIG